MSLRKFRETNKIAASKGQGPPYSRFSENYNQKGNASEREFTKRTHIMDIFPFVYQFRQNQMNRFSGNQFQSISHYSPYSFASRNNPDQSGIVAL